MLLVPGPVPLSEGVIKAQCRQVVSHRDEEFHQLHKKVTSKLAELFNSDIALVFTGSGTAGIEAMVASAVSRHDKVLCLNNGDFGRRLAETCRIYAGGVIEKEIEWGDGFNIERVKKDIDESGAHVLALVQNETSTGVTNAIEAICKYAKSRGMLVLLDTVSAFIGIPLDMRGWGVDIAVAGSQKCIGAPPGMALIGINEGAVKKINDNEIRSYYLNLKKCLKYKEKEETPYTPAVTLYYALDAAIEEVEREGLKNIQERHRRTAEFVRNELVKRGYKLVAEKGFESPTVTAFWGDGKLKDELKKRGVIIAGGQGKLKGKILRIAHLGKFKPEWYKQLFEMIDEIG